MQTMCWLSVMFGLDPNICRCKRCAGFPSCSGSTRTSVDANGVLAFRHVRARPEHLSMHTVCWLREILGSGPEDDGNAGNYVPSRINISVDLYQSRNKPRAAKLRIS